MLTVYDNENILCERSEHGGWELMKSNLKHIKYNERGTDEQKLTISWQGMGLYNLPDYELFI